MDWITRVLRPHHGSKARRKDAGRVRLEIQELEDRAVPAASASIAGSVFFDSNQNGARDANEVAMSGATVLLRGTTDEGKAVNTTVGTTSNGTFRFDALEGGTYQVSVAEYAKFVRADAVLGHLGGEAAGSAIRNLRLEDGQAERDLRFAVPSLTPEATAGIVSLRFFLSTSTPATNFQSVSLLKPGDTGQEYVVDPKLPSGIQSEITTKTATLAGTVYRDQNANGVRGAGEQGLAGVTVVLTGTYAATFTTQTIDPQTGAPKTGLGSVANMPLTLVTTTDSEGKYEFTRLPAGTFTINVEPLFGFRSSGSTVGSLGGAALRTDQLAPAKLSAGQDGTGYDFGLAPFTGGLLDAALSNNFVSNDTAGLVTTDPSVRGQVGNPSQLAVFEAGFLVNGNVSFTSFLSGVKEDGSFFLNSTQLKELRGSNFVNGTYTLVLRAVDLAGNQATKNLTFTIRANATPTQLKPIDNVTAAKSAANKNIFLAGLFDDADIKNTLVTITMLDGNVEKQVHLELFDRQAGASVANFLNYFDNYAQNGGVVVHRVVKQAGLEVVQGGGFVFDSATTRVSTTHLATDDIVVPNEFSTSRPNNRGTIAWAKPGNNPNGASSEFFFNLSDANASTLGASNNGGFAVFGRIQNPGSTQANDELAFLDSIMNTAGRNPQKTGTTLDYAEMPVKGDAANPVLSADNIFRFKQFDITSTGPRELTYTAVSSNPNVVTVSVGAAQTLANNTLTLDYKTAGTSTITVTATDQGGLSVSFTFTVTVTP